MLDHSKSINVFCGASNPSTPNLEKLSIELGLYFKKNSFNLVYGGADIGLMGMIANQCLKNKVKVIGVIPKCIIDFEVAKNDIDELIVVGTMHERKKIMYDKSDAFLILPGGFGTMDEFFEILTWKQLKIHTKKIFILNFEGYFDDLLKFFDSCIENKFIKEADKNNLFKVINNLEELCL